MNKEVESAKVRIRLEVLPGIGDVFGSNGGEPSAFDQEIENGITVGDVLGKVATEHQAFRQTIFDVETGKINEQVAVVLNDRLLEALEGLETSVKDGDVLRFFLVIAGG